MSDKGSEGSDKMSVDFVSEARGMATFILEREHRGPGDTVDAAIHRAERKYGVPANWLRRLRYRRDLSDLPTSAFFAILNAYGAACEASKKAYEAERTLADARDSKLLRLADFVAGKKN